MENETNPFNSRKTYGLRSSSSSGGRSPRSSLGSHARHMQALNNSVNPRLSTAIATKVVEEGPCGPSGKIIANRRLSISKRSLRSSNVAVRSMICASGGMRGERKRLIGQRR